MLKQECHEGEKFCIDLECASSACYVIAVNKEDYNVNFNMKVKARNLRVVLDTHETFVSPPHSSITVKKFDFFDYTDGYNLNVQYSWRPGISTTLQPDDYSYGLPYSQNSRFQVSQGYDGKFTHTGESRYSIDFAMPEGTPVVAARNGRVISFESRSAIGCGAEICSSLGNYVHVLHPDGTIAVYAHLKKDGVLVVPGDTITKGYVIGLSGNTGYSTGPHLHFMVIHFKSASGYESIPTKFDTQEGVLDRLEEGVSYTAK